MRAHLIFRGSVVLGASSVSRRNKLNVYDGRGSGKRSVATEMRGSPKPARHFA